MEQTLLDSLLATMFGKDEIESTAHEFLEAYGGIEVCQKILKMWYRWVLYSSLTFDEHAGK